MSNTNVVQSLTTYFKSEHWGQLMEILNKKDETVNHAHIYVDTSLNPISLEEVIKTYFKKIGHPIERKIEIFTSGVDLTAGTIHGIEPKGLPHFDLLWHYSAETVLGPDPKKTKVEYWGDKFMTEFYSKFPFNTNPNEKEQQEIEAYFSSQAWEKYCELNEDPQVVHIHANVETSVHPELIRNAAIKYMKQRGWEIEKDEPVAFSMRGQWHGKIVFLGNKPEKIFDIAWMYNPLVTLIPSTKYWLVTENPAYDARTMHDLPLLLKKDNYQQLSLRQIEEFASLL